MIKNTINMTSDSDSGYICSYSTRYSASYDAFYAFDGTSNIQSDSGWVSGNGHPSSVGDPQWIKMLFPVVHAVRWYSITSRNIASVNEQPKNWLFQGSNDNITWDTLHTVVNAPAWTNGEKREYTITGEPKLYLYYRLYITANEGYANYVGLAEFCMYDDDTIKKTQMDSIRAKIAAERARRNILIPGVLPSPVWIDPTILADQTKIRKENTNEIRTNTTDISGAATWSEDPTVTSLITKIKQLHFDDVEKLIDSLGKYAGTPHEAHGSGCNVSCIGFCSNTCSGDCTGGCAAACTGYCAGDCTGSCGGGCTGCLGQCQNACGITCSSPSACTGLCTSSCGTTCWVDCMGDENAVNHSCGMFCSAGCWNTCLGNCANNCAGICWPDCQGVCYNNAFSWSHNYTGDDYNPWNMGPNNNHSGGNGTPYSGVCITCQAACLAACSNGGCGINCWPACTPNCNYTCDDNCYLNCGTSCYSICLANCHGCCVSCYGCSSDCQAGCLGCHSDCTGGCDTDCTGGCQTGCDGCNTVCTGGCGALCDSGCSNSCTSTCVNSNSIGGF